MDDSCFQEDRFIAQYIVQDILHAHIEPIQDHYKTIETDFEQALHIHPDISIEVLSLTAAAAASE